MRLDLNEDEAELVKGLLVEALEETRVEEHHARNMDFKAGLMERQTVLQTLLGRLE